MSTCAHILVIMSRCFWKCDIIYVQQHLKQALVSIKNGKPLEQKPFGPNGFKYF